MHLKNKKFLTFKKNSLQKLSLHSDHFTKRLINLFKTKNLHLKLEEATTNQNKVILENNKGLKIVLLHLHHLPPPISIKQVHHSIRGLILLRGGLPYLCSGTRLESFKKCGSKVGQRRRILLHLYGPLVTYKCN